MGAGESKGLSRETADALKRQFVQLAGSKGVVTATDLQNLPELAGNPMASGKALATACMSML
jgi:hypothetical protein